MHTRQKPRQEHDFEADAEQGLAAARDMPPGPERNEALKKAGQLRKRRRRLWPDLRETRKASEVTARGERPIDAQ
jgi:hypothetical protein